MASTRHLLPLSTLERGLGDEVNNLKRALPLSAPETLERGLGGLSDNQGNRMRVRFGRGSLRAALGASRSAPTLEAVGDN
jgi:hypothetical protein